MLKMGHWRCGYVEGKDTPETQAGQKECATTGCQTGLVSTITKCILNQKHNDLDECNKSNGLCII